MTVKGGTSVKILYASFNSLPDKIILDDEEEPPAKALPIQPATELHKLELIWNSPLSNLENMFRGCNSIVNFNFDDFDTSSVNNMAYMFYQCTSLTSLNLQNFITSSVVNMTCMFYGCSSLIYLNVNNFDTSKVTNMKNMFYNVKVLTSLNLTSFKVPQLETMNGMFKSMSKLRFLDLSSFEPLKVTNLDDTFLSNGLLISIDLSNFRTPSVTSMSNTFKGVKSLVSLDLTKFEFSKISTLSNTFNDMSGKLKYCLNTTYKEISQTLYNTIKNVQLKSATEVCSDDCFKVKAERFIILDGKGTCIDQCNITYQYEYQKECNKDCPAGTRSSPDNEFICIYDLNCPNFYNYDMTECIDELVDGYYIKNETLKIIDKCDEKCRTCDIESMKYQICLSCNNSGGFYQMSDDLLEERFNCYNKEDNYYLENYLLYQCYQTCSTCEQGGDDINHNCLSCLEGYWSSGTNCYEHCTYYYYFDSEKKYHCSIGNQCPENYKLIQEEDRCVIECKNEIKYKNEYNNQCYENCPQGYHPDDNNKCIIDLVCEHYYNYTRTGCEDTVPDGFYCNDTGAKTIDKCPIKCKKCTLESIQLQLCTLCNEEGNYFKKSDETFSNENFVNCHKDIDEGYYLDTNVYMPCFETCKKCNGLGNAMNHNCKECHSDSTLNDTNCYKICTYHYYFDESHYYYCTENDQCPEKYPKLIIEKNNCVESCINEYKYEFDNKCYNSCPEGTYYNYSHTGCIDTIPIGFYNNDTTKKTIEKCDIKCKQCDLQSTNNELCISCNNEGNFYLKENDNSNIDTYINCYKNRPDGYYFSEEDKIFKKCYETCESCSELGNIVNHKCTACYSDSTLNNTNCYKICSFHYYFDESYNYYCTENEQCPDIYPKLIIEKNECVESCVEDFKYEFDNKCYQSCPEGTYYNYEHTGCIDTIPQGYYLNDSESQTIDKCDIKCKNCNSDSVLNNLCASCNENEGYFPKHKENVDIEYMDCFNEEPNGFFFDDDNKSYKECYKTCKSCSDIGDIEEQKCTSCYDDFTLNGTNCYKKCDYFYYFDQNKEYQCTTNDACPDNNNKLINGQKECVEKCDNSYKYEYNNMCYRLCPDNTFYNYDDTGCIEEIPDGYYCNDTDKQTIEKCDIKCYSCSLESVNKNLCDSCNNALGYYQKNNDASNIDSYINCYKDITEGFYLYNNVYLSCFETCKACNGLGNNTYHNCKECNMDSTLNDTNCYKICEFHYYFDELYNYYCTENIQCPEEYPKLIVEKNECVKNCVNKFKYEFDNKCYQSCPEGTYYNYEHTGCIDIIPQGYYLNDSESQTIDKCDVKCQKCDLTSSKNNLCISCNNEQQYYLKENDDSNIDEYINCYNKIQDGTFYDDINKIFASCYKTCKECTEVGLVEEQKCTKCYKDYTLNGTNCYQICDYLYYFDENKEYHCTKDDKCPEEFPKKIKEKNKCIVNCSDDSYYKLEYNGICYNECPRGTKIEEDDPNICIGYLICEKLYNYDHTECLEEVPDGFFVNDTAAKTIDKCNNKCKKCSADSNENNLCVSCNINEGYYSKEKGDMENNNGFIECYSSLSDISDGDGYFFDSIDNIFKKCFKTCKKCSKRGNINNHECEECYPGSTLNDSNCYEECEYLYYFDSSKEYHCTEKEECPPGYKLIEEKNQCIDKCNNDDIYKFEYKNRCYQNPIKPECSNDSLYINKITEECLNECSGTDFFNNICGFRNSSDNNNDLMIKIIQTDIETGLMNPLLENISYGNESEFLIQEKDISYLLTNVKKIKTNKSRNTSSISLGDCEEELKRIYGIDKNQSLIIFQVDYYTNYSLIPIIGYEVFHPINKSKLDLNYCEGQLVSIEYPAQINEKLIYIYNPNSDFYYDNCYPYTTENGTDILLEDRQNEYNKNKLAICENNCAFKEYVSETQKSICICEIKTEQISINEIINQDNLFSNSFLKNKSSCSTFETMKCYYSLFSINGIYKNYCFYLILLFCFFSTIISAFIFYIKSFNSLMKIIEEIVREKEKNTENENIDIKEKENDLKEKYKQNVDTFLNIIKVTTPKHKKLTNLTYKGIIPQEDISSLNNYSSNQKSISKINLKTNKDITYSKKKTIQLSKNNLINNIDKYNDYEMNSFPYKIALENDNRSFFSTYLSLIKTKHPIIFSIDLKDYNSAIIKTNLLVFSFCIYYFINGLFINKEVVHKLYEQGGKYDITIYVKNVIYSFLISHFITNIIKFFFLTERNILYIKRETNYKKLLEKTKEVKKLLVSKYIFYFSICFILELFFGYNLSSFSAVYQNTQLVLLKNTLLSIAISFIYPFVINLVPAAFRVISLKDESKCLFNLSKILQVL